MKIAIFTDVHWSTNTSIVRQRGDKYSLRLEMLIKGLCWFNELAKKNECGLCVCAGDFFDKSTCNDEELSALKEVNWLDEYHQIDFIVGNHESSRQDLEFTSVDALSSDSFRIIKKVMVENYKDVQIYYLPYITEYDRKPLKEYLIDYDESKKHIIFSHNDIANIQYGGFLSKTGFSVEEIEQCCDLYLNGHIHNSEWITKKILNLGSMTAQNFTNDSFKYKYGAWILDTDTMSLDFFENPYSLNFYKIDVESAEDLSIFKNLKDNAVVSCKCIDSLKDELQKTLSDTKGIITYKIIYTKENVALDASNEQITLNSKDHLEQFKEYITQTLGLSEVVQQELLEVCK